MTYVIVVEWNIFGYKKYYMINQTERILKTE
jgi:hypothetical protein